MIFNFHLLSFKAFRQPLCKLYSVIYDYKIKTIATPQKHHLGLSDFELEFGRK